MLYIWMGRAGSGKSGHVMRAIASLQKKRKQILLVPEHCSHEAEVDVCRSCGDESSNSVEVLTFESLADRVLSLTGGQADFVLDNGGKILTMRRCLQELSGELKVFGKPSQRASFLNQLTALADEFYSYNITPRYFDSHVKDLPGAMGEKMQDISKIFALYDSRMHAENFDCRSKTQRMAGKIGESDYFQGKDVYLDGFTYFNRQEEIVLEEALRTAHNVTVTLLGDAEDETLFKNAQRQKKRLLEKAKQMKVEAEVVYYRREDPSDLGHLEKYFLGDDVQYDDEVQHISLYEAGTPYTEVEAIAAKIRQLTSSGKCRYRDIAVTARNMDVYTPLIRSVFWRDEIPVYVSQRTDILNKPILMYLISAVEAVTGGFEYEEMFRYLKTGFAGINAEECDLLENYCILWSIRGVSWIRDKKWTMNPRGYGEIDEKAQERLDRINEIRDKVREPLKLLYDGVKGTSSIKSKVYTLYRFAELTKTPEYLEKRAHAFFQVGWYQDAEEYQQLWGIFCQVLDQFVEILGDEEVNSDEFCRLFRLALTQYSVGTIPATVDQVKVSDLMRNDRHQVKYLFLLGATDNVLPSVSKAGGLLDDDDREVLEDMDVHLSDSSVDALDNELQHIYACLAMPSGHLTVSWPETDVSGSDLRPSFVVQRIRSLFPKIRVAKENLKYRSAMPHSALELAGEEPNGPIWQYFAERDDYAQVINAMHQARYGEKMQLSKEAVEWLYGKNISMSASRIDKIRSCHFGYFMEYGLKAKERKAAGFEAPEIGTFLHYLLENITRDASEKGGYSQMEHAELEQLVHFYTEKFVREEIKEFEEKSARFRYLFTRLKKTALSIIENMAEELAKSDFQPVDFELAFGGKDAALPPVKVSEDGTNIKITGKVDRVDSWVQGDKLYLRVVDYKTGKKAFSLSDVRYGLGIQMLLYLFTLQNEGKTYYGKEIVPAGVLYMPAREILLREARNTSDEELKKERDKNLKRSGMVLKDPAVIEAMEHGALDKAQFLPIRVKKDGEITDGVASLEQMGRLGQYVEKLLHEIAGEIGSGDVSTNPCMHTPTESACLFCPYASACYFDKDSGDGRYLKKMKNEEFWKYIEGGEEAVKNE